MGEKSAFFYVKNGEGVNRVRIFFSSLRQEKGNEMSEKKVGAVGEVCGKFREKWFIILDSFGNFVFIILKFFLFFSEERNNIF